MVDTIGTKDSDEVSLFQGLNRVNKNCLGKNVSSLKTCVRISWVSYQRKGSPVIIVTQVEWERGDVTVTGALSVFDRDGYEFSFSSTITIDLDTCTNTAETLKCTLNYGENQKFEVTTSIRGKWSQKRQVPSVQYVIIHVESQYH